MAYVHLGADITVPENEIIGIFDMDITTVTAGAREYLARAQRHGGIYYVSLDVVPRSFVVTAGRVYVTTVARRTLRGRACVRAYEDSGASAGTRR